MSRFPWYATGLVLATVAGVLLRADGIANRSIWFDEAFSWRITTFPIDEAVDRVARDNHPPLYFLLLKAWAAVFGTSEVALRSLSVLLGGATVVASALVAREVVRARGAAQAGATAGRAAGLIAAALVAVSVVHVRWTWEVRMYTLGTTLAAMTSWAMLRAIRLRTTGAWVGYGALALAFAYTHYYALFSLAAQAVYVAGHVLRTARWHPGRLIASPTFWNVLLAAGIVAIGWLPWVPVFLAQRQQVQDDYWTIPVRSRDVARGVYRLFVTPENGPIGPTEAWVVAGAAALLLLALLGCRPRGGELYLVLAAAFPVALPVALSNLGTDVFHPRYLLFGHLHLLIGLGVLIGRVRDVSVRTSVALIVVVNGLIICADFRDHLRVWDRPGMKAAMAQVNTERRPGEWVVVSMSLIHSPMVYYVADPKDCYLYDDGRPIPHYRGVQVILPGELVDDQRLTAYGPGRVWAVNMRGGNWGNYSVPEFRQWKKVAEYSFPEVYDIQGEIVITLYEVPAADGSPK